MGSCWLVEAWKAGQFSQKIPLRVLQEEVACVWLPVQGIGGQNLVMKHGFGEVLQLQSPKVAKNRKLHIQARVSYPANTIVVSPVKLVSYAGLQLEFLSTKYVQIHGLCRLPPGYMLARLHPDYKVKWELPLQPTEPVVSAPASAPSEQEALRDEECSISSNYSVIRPIIAFFQLLSAVPLIYRAHTPESRGTHGYAGYQLTVIPFVLMSLINTLTSFATPDYGASYMIRSSIMKEAEGRGGRFDGVTGSLCESSEKISLGVGELIPGHGDIIGEVGRCDGHRIVFGPVGMESSLICPAKPTNRRTHFLHGVIRACHFVFRQQVWEGVREELPVVRWILYWIESAKEAPGTQGSTSEKVPRVNPNRTCITRLFKRYTSGIKKSGR